MGPNGQQTLKYLKALKIFLKNPAADFKGEQLKAIHFLNSEIRDLIVIAPTSSGKSLLFQLTAALNPEMTIVVVVPFKNLLNNQREKLQEAGITHWVFSENEQAAPNVQIVLVQVERISSNLLDYLTLLNLKLKLKMVVLDEAHEYVVSQTYRPKLEKIRLLKRIPVPLLLLSATLPRDLEEAIVKDLHMEIAAKMKSPNIRPNICYYFVVGNSFYSMKKSVIYFLTQLLPEERMIIFVPSRRDCEDMGGRLGMVVNFYHGEMKDEERERNERNWREGRTKIMVATTAMGQGYDYGSVRVVLQYQRIYSLLQYAQQTGKKINFF